MEEIKQTQVKEQGDTMPEQSEPTQKQIIDGLAQQVIALDKEKAQLHKKISDLEDKLLERELAMEKAKVAYDEKYSECLDLKAKLGRADETIKELTEKNDNLHKDLEDVKEELISLIEEEVDSKKCEMPIRVEEDINYYTSWEKKVAELHLHLEGEKTFYENKIKLLKHELIEFPGRKAILEKKIKYNTEHLKHVNRIIKAVLK